MQKFSLKPGRRRFTVTGPAGLLALMLAPLAGCEEAPGTDAGIPPPCVDAAMLQVDLYGSIEASLDWQAGNLECSGMPRPAGQGGRLRFSGSFGPPGEARRLTFIVALPQLERGTAARETPATVTLIEEDTGRFFSSGEAAICWSDITRHEPIAAGENSGYRVGGIVYCVSPLAELNGAGGVSFTDLAFSGRVDWDGPK